MRFRLSVRSDSATKVGRHVACVTIALALCLGVGRVEGREWFVAVGGAGPGTEPEPFGRIQDGLEAAQPGDTVTVQAGLYPEAIRSVRSGVEGAPIRVRAKGGRGSVVVSALGRVLAVGHAYFTVEGLVLDGQYGAADTVDVTSGAHALVLRNVEVRRSSRDLIDIDSPHGVLIENSLIHHALNATAGRTDAHGIAAGAVRDLTIRDTEIHTFSGDGLQVDPGRSAPGWSRVIVEGSRIWLAPLVSAENGFAAGVVPGENAIDTKASARYERAVLVVRDTAAWGFRDGLLGNMAAFNLKENVEVTIDRVTVHDSEIAFRLRGPTATTAAGARVTLQNAVIYNTSTAFRFENNIESLQVWNSTVGLNVTRPFHAASSNADGLDVRNLLVVGPVPAQAANPSNRGVGPDAFVNAAAHNYELVAGSAAIDAGVNLPGVTTDRNGIARPQGKAHDIGAFEWVPPGG